MNQSRAMLLLTLPVLAAGCATRPEIGASTPRSGQEIVVCGQLVHVGAPVVLWTDPGGYDAYSTKQRFARPDPAGEQPSDSSPTSPRYGRRSRPSGDPLPTGGDPDAWTVADLARVVDQFVVHYDVSGTSRQCFHILHDVRGLSAHFLLDLDGTIYQTLDVKERAWHATVANNRSIGIEIAQIGAYPPDNAAVLDNWYTRDELEWRVSLPASMGDGGVRTADFIARPARPGPIDGVINGRLLRQHDFTPEQYESLSRLLAALNSVLPAISLEAPRDAQGAVLTRTLTAEEFAAYHGVLGHYHIQANKIDPGPAFDWQRALQRARSIR